jgi:hypothetical protein
VVIINGNMGFGANIPFQSFCSFYVVMELVHTGKSSTIIPDVSYKFNSISVGQKLFKCNTNTISPEFTTKGRGLFAIVIFLRLCYIT